MLSSTKYLPKCSANDYYIEEAKSLEGTTDE